MGTPVHDSSTHKGGAIIYAGDQPSTQKEKKVTPPLREKLARLFQAQNTLVHICAAYFCHDQLLAGKLKVKRQKQQTFFSS